MLLILAIPGLVKAQLLQPKVCNLVGTSGILLQQVDENWNKIPFDCLNIEVLIISQSYVKSYQPGEIYSCKYKFDSSGYSNVPILGEQPGVYDIIVKRLDEKNYFQKVVVDWDDSGCDVVGQILEIQFDMSK